MVTRLKVFYDTVVSITFSFIFPGKTVSSVVPRINFFTLLVRFLKNHDFRSIIFSRRVLFFFAENRMPVAEDKIHEV